MLISLINLVIIILIIKIRRKEKVCGYIKKAYEKKDALIIQRKRSEILNTVICLYIQKEEKAKNKIHNLRLRI
jgi:hypothetical protein